MNGFRYFIKGLQVITVAVAACSVVSLAQAQDITLSDGNSTALVDLGSSSGMHQWSVEGVNQLAQQWFWYRVGATGTASPINALGGLTYTQAGMPNYLMLSYNSGQVEVQVEYLLTGGGYGQSQIKESISLFNHGSSAIDFHFFQYSDFDLAGNPSGDSVSITGSALTGFSQALQVKGPTQIAEAITLPYASHAEASAVQNAIRDRLNTVNGLTLNDTTSAGPGDAAWAYEWDFQIGANSSVEVLKDKTLNVTPVPEPSSLGLLALGMAAAAVWRKQLV